MALPLQTGFSGKPVLVSKTFGAAFLLVEMVSQGRNFLVCRFEIEIRILGRVGIHQKRAFNGFHA